MRRHEVEQNRIFALRDVLDNETGILAASGHVAGEFSERPVVIHLVQRDFAFENHLRLRGDVKIRGPAANQL